jgi:uncharacterized protein
MKNINKIEIVNQFVQKIPVYNETNLEASMLLDESIDDAREIFLVPILDTWLLYAPLQGILTLVSTSAANKIRQVFQSKEYEALIATDSMLSFFDRQGLFQKSNVDKSAFNEPFKHWKPTHVTFSTTQKCTLRCTYCYAEGGRLDDIDIPREIAKGAIDLIIRNAELDGQNPSINFLGEGEATASWKEFCWVIDYFRKECVKRNLIPYIDLSTNGVFPKKRISYIAEVCNGITFSLDGLEEVHNKYRILPNGKGSFSQVISTMKAFDQLGKNYHIRSTISIEALSSLSDFIHFIGNETKCKNIQLEPIFDVKSVTSLQTEINCPNADLFIENYRKAKQVAAEYGIEIYYSGADTSRKLTFCSATSAKNFLVTARGIITSCNEVLKPTDPRSPLFQYGEWNLEAKEFVVDSERINKLGRLNSLEINKCQGCIAKFNCAGDCYAKTAVSNGDPWAAGYTYRCAITRELLKDNLLLSLLTSEIGEFPTSKWVNC